MTTDSPFRRVIDDLTDGCGCCCHTGLGYRAGCEHCIGGGSLTVCHECSQSTSGHCWRHVRYIAATGTG
jgi:hypothetical protein